jgi:glycosyltransferase involved in cell wall biosynthesis
MDGAWGEQPPRLWSREHATLGEAREVGRYIRRTRPDVVHVQDNLGLVSARFLAGVTASSVTAGIPLVATLHGRRGRGLRRGRQFWSHVAAYGAAPLVVHNEAHRRELFPRPRVVVIPHGIATPAKPDVAAARAALGIAPDEWVLAHFGFLHPHKGVEPVLEALAALKRGGRRVRFLVCGAVPPDGDGQRYLEQLRRRVAELGLDGEVLLDGKFLAAAELSGRLAAADWILLNYQSGGEQGTSGAVRTALESGRPTAVSEAAIFDDVRDAVHTVHGNLAGALEELARRPELAIQVAARARAHCEDGSWASVARRHLALYRSVVR